MVFAYFALWIRLNCLNRGELVCGILFGTPCCAGAVSVFGEAGGQPVTLTLVEGLLVPALERLLQRMLEPQESARPTVGSVAAELTRLAIAASQPVELGALTARSEPRGHNLPPQRTALVVRSHSHVPIWPPASAIRRRSSLSRSACSYSLRDVMSSIAPGSVPRLLDVDPETFTLVIEEAPQGWRPWKALLLEGNRVVPFDRLLDELWAEAPPSTARKSLHVRASKLRKALGDPALW